MGRGHPVCWISRLCLTSSDLLGLKALGTASWTLKELERLHPPTTSTTRSSRPGKDQGISKVKITPFVGVIIYGVITRVTYFWANLQDSSAGIPAEKMVQPSWWLVIWIYPSGNSQLRLSRVEYVISHLQLGGPLTGWSLLRWFRFSKLFVQEPRLFRLTLLQTVRT